MKQIPILPSQMSEELAELVGIHFGDGNISIRSSHDYRITIFCNSKEKDYISFIFNLFHSVFGISLTIKEYPNKNCTYLDFYSKELCAYYEKKLFIYAGKKNNLTIPQQIAQNKKYLAAFIRGVFDTDGCVTYQRSGKYVYPLAKISTKHKEFANELKNGLEKSGIKSYICRGISYIKDKGHIGYHIVARNNEAKKFMEIIDSHNQKNIEKWGRRDFQAMLFEPSSTAVFLVIGLRLISPCLEAIIKAKRIFSLF